MSSKKEMSDELRKLKYNTAWKIMDGGIDGIDKMIAALNGDYFVQGFDACFEAMSKTHVPSGQVEKLVEALEFYAKHPSVISEAYHTGIGNQIQVVHTFINHQAIEALAAYEQAIKGSE